MTMTEMFMNGKWINRKKEKENNTMKKSVILLLSIISLPFHSMAYIISKLLNIKGVEDMLTPEEWLAMYKDSEFYY